MVGSSVDLMVELLDVQKDCSLADASECLKARQLVGNSADYLGCKLD